MLTASSILATLALAAFESPGAPSSPLPPVWASRLSFWFAVFSRPELIHSRFGLDGHREPGMPWMASTCQHLSHWTRRRAYCTVRVGVVWRWEMREKMCKTWTKMMSKLPYRDAISALKR